MPANEHMRKRCKRYNEPGHAHELTFTCYKSRAFLSRDRTRQYLADAIIAAREKQGFDLWAYVFMPEHVHLLIWPRESPYSVSGILQTIKQAVARRAVNYLKRHDPAALALLRTTDRHHPYRFWLDGGGYDRNITSVETLRDVMEYIHANPVRRGLVKKPEDWVWSSYRDWAGIGVGPVPIDRESFPLLPPG